MLRPSYSRLSLAIALLAPACTRTVENRADVATADSADVVTATRDAIDSTDTAGDSGAPSDAIEPADAPVVPRPCATCGPRPIAPASGTQTNDTPRFMWAFPETADLVRVEIARDAAFTAMEATMVSSDPFAVPSMPLARGVHYWRAFAHVGGAWGTTPSATWTFEVRVALASRYAPCFVRSDFDGNGRADLAVASTTAREINVYSGTDSMFPSTPAVTLHGPDATAMSFGWPLISAGDVDGDGFGDLLAMNFAADRSQAMYLYRGGPTSLATTPSLVFHDPTPVGGTEYAQYSFGRAGDLNRDGFADVVMSAFNTATVSAAYVYYGSPTGPRSTADLVLSDPAPTTSSQFGRSTSGIGDFNGDGYDDMAVGDRMHLPHGRVYLYFGGEHGIASTPSLAVEAASAHDFGSPIAPAGDVNGDGLADFVATGIRTGITGTVYVVLGTASGTPTVIALETPTVNVGPWGEVLGCIGDANGDGFGDVAVSGAAGGLYVYAGSAAGIETAPRLAMPSLGDDPNANYGTGFARLGDIDADGFDDYAVAATESASGGQPRVLVFRGAAMLATMPWQVIAGPMGTGFAGGLAMLDLVARWPAAAG